MTHNTNPGGLPDIATVKALAAARTPEQTAARQARIASWRIGTAAMQLGEQFLADGDLATARSWFEIAAQHQALDATERLATVAVLAEAMEDSEFVRAAASSPLAGEDHEPHQDRDDAVDQLDAAADVVRAAHARAESIVADAHEQARLIVARARASTVPATTTAATESELMAPAALAFTPDLVFSMGSSRFLIQAKCFVPTDDADLHPAHVDQSSVHQVRRSVQAEMAVVRAHLYHRAGGDLPASLQIPVAAPTSTDIDQWMSAPISSWSWLHLSDAWEACTALISRSWTRPAADGSAARVREAWQRVLAVDVQHLDPLWTFRLQPVSDVDIDSGLWLPHTVHGDEQPSTPDPGEDAAIDDGAVRQQAGCV